MNKLTKVGLTALATTLVSSASFAGEMSVYVLMLFNLGFISSSSGENIIIYFYTSVYKYHYTIMVK